MANSFLITGIIITGILALISLIVTTISFKNNKKSTGIVWVIIFAMALSCTIFCFCQLIRKLPPDIKALPANDKPLAIDRSKERKVWLDTLKAYTNESFEDKLPADAYENKVADTTNGRLILPFLYPHVLNYDPATKTASIANEFTDSILVENVSQMAFDQNFVIAMVDNSGFPALLKSGHAATEYLLYDMRTRNFEPATSKDQLMDFAKRIGYVGSLEMKPVSESYKAWLND